MDNNHPAVFLDRDGTIIVEKGFLGDPTKVELIPGASDAIRKLNKAGYAVIIVSNQSGVARGYFDEDTVRVVNDHVNVLFERENASIDMFYYCPHYSDGSVPGYAIDCPCRKPAAGMIEKAKEELGITPALVVGDRESDIMLAVNIGVPGILVLTGYGNKQSPEVKQKAGFVAKSIEEGIDWFLMEKDLLK